jgi:hypothetical protein
MNEDRIAIDNLPPQDFLVIPPRQCGVGPESQVPNEPRDENWMRSQQIEARTK